MIIDWGENGGSTTREEDGTFTAERLFWAKADVGTDRELDVEQYRECPRRGDPHPTETEARCTSVIVRRRTPGNRLFDVTCTYSNKFERPEEKNPLDRRAKIRMRTQFFEVPAREDARGRPVQTTAGEPFDGYVRRIAGRTISIQKNVSTWPEWINTYATAISSDTVRIRGRTYPRHTLRMGIVDLGDEDFENSVRFFSLAYELEYNPLTWLAPRLNRSLHELVDGFEAEVDGKLKWVRAQKDAAGAIITPPNGLPPDPPPQPAQRLLPIEDDEGQPVTTPYWLDAEGRAIRRPTPDDVIVLDFRDYDELPFSRLPLT